MQVLLTAAEGGDPDPALGAPGPEDVGARLRAQVRLPDVSGGFSGAAGP